MGVNEDLGRAADEVIGRVTDAVKYGNYQHLSSDISQMLLHNERIITDDIRRSIGSGASYGNRGYSDGSRYGNGRPGGGNFNSYGAGPYNSQQMPYEHGTPFMRNAQNSMNLTASVVLFAMLVIGDSFVVCFFLIAMLVSFLVFGGIGAFLAFAVGFCLFGALDICFIRSLKKVIKRRTNNRLFIKYGQIIGTREYETMKKSL